MNKITVNRGNDGFGSQLLSILSGIAYAKNKNAEYVHTPLKGIKLLDKPDLQNDELDEVNSLLLDFTKNLNIKLKNNEERILCLPFFHHVIEKEGVDNFYTKEFSDMLFKAYPKKKPNYYENNFNIAIHIRRGSDIFDSSDIQCRIIQNSVYKNILTKFLITYPTAKIHIYSWNLNDIDIEHPNITYHISKTGGKFLEHFNGLVHADMLVVGSSTFSISAGLINNKTVICNNELCKLQQTPIPSFWTENYNTIIG